MTKRPMACDSYKIFFNNINDPQTWSSSSWMEPVSTIYGVMMRQTNGGDYSFMRSIAAAALIIIDYFLGSTLMIPIEETRIHPLMGQSRTMLTFTGPYIYIYIYWHCICLATCIEHALNYLSEFMDKKILICKRFMFWHYVYLTSAIMN